MMIHGHRYTTTYAGVDPERRKCAYVYPDGIRCTRQPEEHSDVVARAYRAATPDPDHQPMCEMQMHPKAMFCTCDFPEPASPACGSDDVDMVEHPPHYQGMPGIDFECIEVTRGMTFNAGNAVKYMWRTDRKNGREDVRKAQWYVRDALEHHISVYCEPGASYDNLLLQVVNATNGFRSMFFEAVRIGNWKLADIMLDALLLEMDAA